MKKKTDENIEELSAAITEEEKASENNKKRMHLKRIIPLLLIFLTDLRLCSILSSISFILQGIDGHRKGI